MSRTTLLRRVQITRDLGAKKVKVWSNLIELVYDRNKNRWKPCAKDKGLKPLLKLTIDECQDIFNIVLEQEAREVCFISVNLLDGKGE